MRVFPRFVPAVFAFGFVVAACGGGGETRPPLVADSPPPSPEPFEDAGTAPESKVVEADAGASSTPAPPSPSPSPSSSASSSETPGGAVILQGNEDGARALLAQFVAANADHSALTRSLRPSAGDYKALFDAKTAAKIEAAQAKDWDSGKAAIKPKPGQTEVKVWSATGADLAAGKGAAKEFPAGYKKVGKHLAHAQLFFRFKFVEPGKDSGTAYDGLAFVNSHWVIAPKPWRAIEGKSGSLDEGDADAAAPAPAHAKPAGKPKGKPKKK